jgi:uncharacterized damage-inducible protein DinB
MRSTVDKIIEEFRVLPPEEQQRLLEVLEQETRGSERARRVELSQSIKGKYAHLLTGSEEFIALKREETRLTSSTKTRTKRPPTPR